MTTARDIINKAMLRAGILTKTETPDYDEANDALDTLNQMLASWSNEAMLIYARTWETFTMIAGQGEYTIGPGQQFNTVRPINVVGAYFRMDGELDFPMEKITDEAYNAYLYQKNIQSTPEFYNYDNGFPIAKIRIWPVPLSNYGFFILSEKQLAQFILDDDVILPPGWERALIYNLAVELCPEYGQDVSPALMKLANESKGSIQRTILKNRTMDALPSAIQRYNILSDIR